MRWEGVLAMGWMVLTSPALAQPALPPVASAYPSMDRFVGAHPRLLCTAGRFAAIRGALTTTHAALWRAVKEDADRAVRSKPPGLDSRQSDADPEQLWQRPVGNTMALLAAAYAVSGDRSYARAAAAWAAASCSYPTWGRQPYEDADLAAGHQLFGLAIVYDYCFDTLSAPERALVRSTLLARGGKMYRAVETGKAWWRDSFLQNHQYVDLCGLTAAVLAIYDEEPAARQWLPICVEKLSKASQSLGDDGASHEGVGYWQYGLENLLKFSAMVRPLLGVDVTRSPWWRNTARYGLYLSLPRHAWTSADCTVDLGDSPRSNWYGPDYLLRRLAAVNGDGHAQWLAQQIATAGTASRESGWLNLIWYDPAVPATPPDRLPTLHHFEDIGIVSARSSWSGNESLLVFKCGPYVGHKALRLFDYDPGAGHVHPDANHLLLFGNGQWLLRDDGYAWKMTGQHNTLLVDGRGQMGEGQMWFNAAEVARRKPEPRMVRVQSSPAVDVLTGDAAPAYPRDSGLTRFVRTVVFIKPNAVLVFDDIAAAGEHEFELRFHPEAQRCERRGSALLFPGRLATLRLEPLRTAAAAVECSPLPTRGRDGGPGEPLLTVRVRTRARAWHVVTALTWAGAGREPVTASAREANGATVLRLGAVEIRWDWATHRAVLRTARVTR